ncbi:DUF1287 domain-containing protein [Candidatus Desantisbacteria bacterium]|nr:DUF1287 domain-containing protein [Candidatus Desantisbacteria bacterium]
MIIKCFVGKNLIKLKLIIIITLSLSSCSPSVSFNTEEIEKIKQNVPENVTTFQKKIRNAALDQIGITRDYDPAYEEILYPMGDIDMGRGVCTDVVIRALRKVNLDLQQLIHEDMKNNFDIYPKKWGHTKPDPNIDHRRVPNIMTFLKRRGLEIKEISDPGSFKTGDVVAWKLFTGNPYIGIVVKINFENEVVPFIVHNIGFGTKLENRLFDWKIIGHYRIDEKVF